MVQVGGTLDQLERLGVFEHAPRPPAWVDEIHRHDGAAGAPAGRRRISRIIYFRLNKLLLGHIDTGSTTDALAGAGPSCE
jgi:hypothetical protein